MAMAIAGARRVCARERRVVDSRVSTRVATSLDDGSTTYWASGITADVSRREAIVRAAREAYAAYEAHAFGHDEVAPVTMRGLDDFGGVGATIIDSLDTLHIMGLRDEFNRALMWLKRRDSALSALARGEVNRDVSVFETNIRY